LANQIGRIPYRIGKKIADRLVSYVQNIIGKEMKTVIVFDGQEREMEKINRKVVNIARN
jgi:hypothetical protein